jgi:tRNA(Arg) A34 adenosine deaminase TadA
MENIAEISLTLPDWVDIFLNSKPDTFEAIEDRMRFVIELSRQNVLHKTGGPFGAAIFEQVSGRLVSVGINRVVPLSCSLAHAEMMAFTFAQKKLQTFNLGLQTLPDHQLVTSAQMCAMCFGATPWSGVRNVVCGATAEDVESLVGFDEGPIHPNWIQELNKRGISVQTNVLQSEACEVLKLYALSSGIVYNGCGKD